MTPESVPLETISPEPCSWVEIECITHHIFEEAVSDIMIGSGVWGTWSEQNPSGFVIHGYYQEIIEKSSPVEKMSLLLNNIPAPPGTFQLTVKPYEERDWLIEWKKYYKPVRISANLLIVPSWDKNESDTGTIVRINPGKAFGTGGHPTTRLCLRELEEVISGWEGPPPSLLDVGCGSAILSIAAVKLGVADCVAVDNDRTALENAEENIILNGLSLPLRSEIPVGKKFDILVSNILAETHCQLKDTFHECLHRNGIMILSGILDDCADEVIRAFEGISLKMEQMRREGEWVCLRFRKTS